MHRSLQLCFPRSAHVGPGAVERLGAEAAARGRKALLVTGRRALRRAGTLDRLLDILRKAGVAAEVFDDVPPEPDVPAVDRAREALRCAGCDLVVEAGGGSALDVGKAAAALARAEEPTAVYHGGRELPAGGLPHLAVPTTAGTGSEATHNSVLTDAAHTVKKSIRGAGLMPDVCIVDAELTLSCPRDVTSASGMDALAQAIESYLSIYAVPTTEALSLEAARMIAAGLPAAFERGDDLAARAAMAEASFMAGVALGSARLGAVHGLAHPLGVIYGLPHGVVCAVLLAPVLRLNAPGAPVKYARLAEAMGGDPVRQVERLRERLGMPRVIGPALDADRLRAVVDYAVPSGSSRANPVPVDEAYVRRVLDAVCS